MTDNIKELIEEKTTSKIEKFDGYVFDKLCREIRKSQPKENNTKLKEKELEAKREFTKCNRAFYKFVEEYYTMSVLKCNRKPTSISALDKTGEFIKRWKMMYMTEAAVKLANIFKNQTVPVDQYDEWFIQKRMKEEYFNDICIKITAKAEQLQKKLCKISRYPQKASIDSSIQRVEMTQHAIFIANDLIGMINKLGETFRNCIPKLTTYVFLAEDIRSDIVENIRVYKNRLRKYYQKVAFIVDKSMVRKIFLTFVTGEYRIDISELYKMLKYLSPQQRRLFQREISYFMADNPKRKTILYKFIDEDEIKYIEERAQQILQKREERKNKRKTIKYKGVVNNKK